MHKFRKLSAILITIVLLVSLSSFTAFAAEADTKTLTVIHVNDRHGNTNADPVISQMVKDLKAEGKNVLLLDAGDTVHGSTLANLSKGAAMIEIMNAVGYDVMTVGNHDINFGIERLEELSGMADFPMLAGNVKKDGVRLFDSYKIFEFDGLKVGVFGVATKDIITKSDPRIVAGLTVENPTETARTLAQELKVNQDCDIVIALAHVGIDMLDEFSINGYVDLIIDGHSHTALPNGSEMGSALIAQTGAFAENIGVVELTVNGTDVEKSAKLIPITEELLTDAAIQTAVDAENAKNEPLTNTVIGNTSVVLNGERGDVRTKETNLTNVVTDSMKWATGADIAFITGGNIRATIDAGDITMGEALMTLPYSNLLTTVKLVGKDVLKMLEHGVSAYPEASPIFIHVSGIKFDFDADAAVGSRVLNVRMSDGSAFDVSKTYTVATIEFLAAGGDGYDMVTRGTDLVYYGGDAEALAGYLESKPTISENTDGRVTVKAKTPEQTAVTQIIYTVKKGDNLTKIANKYHTTWRDIYNRNKDKINNPNLIYIGQQLLIPSK